MTASYRGFKERNTRVAASDAILAFTFGAGAIIVSGQEKRLLLELA